jgi:hypothetical protein
LQLRCSGRSKRGFLSSWPKSHNSSGPMGWRHLGQTGISPRSYTHVLSDGRELDYSGLVWFAGPPDESL